MSSLNLKDGGGVSRRFPHLTRTTSRYSPSIFEPSLSLHTISALTHRQIVELLERKVITAELFDEAKIVEVFDPEEPKRRYCLCRNPLTAGREGKTRERLLERTRAELERIASSKRRASAKTLGARVGRVLERSKMGKFVRWDVSMDGSHGALIKTRLRPRNSSTVVTL